LMGGTALAVVGIASMRALTTPVSAAVGRVQRTHGQPYPAALPRC